MLAKRFHTRWTAEQEKRAEALSLERDRVAAELDLDPSMIAPRATLEAIAANPGKVLELLLPWQRTLLALDSPSAS